MRKILLGLMLMGATAHAGDPVATTGTSGNLLTEIAQHGVTFPITYYGEVLGNPTGGKRQGAIYDGVLEAGVAIDFSQLTKWKGLTFTADIFYPHGSSITRNDVHDLNVLSNIDALHNPRLYELWLDQVLFDGKLDIRVGQIPADTEFSIAAYSYVFLNSVFGMQPSIALNMAAPTYPVAVPGVRVIYKPSEQWVLMGAVFNGSAGDAAGANRNGTDFDFSSGRGTLSILEAAYTVNPPSAQPAPSGAPGDGKQVAAKSRPLSTTYKLGGFLNTEDFTDTKTGGTLHGDYGVYAMIDSELYHEPGDPNQGLRGYARASYVPPDRNEVAFDAVAGLNYTGLLPGRGKDLLDLGFAYTKVSTDTLNIVGAAPGRHYESILELTYVAPLNDHLSLQPDVQYIFNPGGGYEKLGNALVLGLRVNMHF